MLSEALPIFTGGAFIVSSRSHGIHQSIFTQFTVFSKCNYGQTGDNLRSIMWSERSSDRSQSSPGNCPSYITWTDRGTGGKSFDQRLQRLRSQIWASLLLVQFSRANEKTMQVSQLSWLSECQGFTPDRVIQGYFSCKVILQLRGQLAKVWVLW